MLENTDTLLSLAEIAAAFAGFAALVSVIRPGRRERGEALHDLLRLRVVIASSVAGVAAALVPVGLGGYGIDPDTIWRVSALLFLVFGYAIIGALARSYRPLRAEIEPDRVATIVVSGIELVEQTSLAIILLGIPFGNPGALYVTALIGNICQTGFVFVRFVGSTFRRQVAED